MSGEQRSERRRIAYCRSRSLSFNSQSFDTAVPGCPRVVRKIPRIVFIQVRGRRVQPRGLFLSISPSPSSPPFPHRPTLVSATIFSSFRNRLRREDNGLHHRATGRFTRKRSHRSRSSGGNRAVSSFLAGSFRASYFREESSTGGGVFTEKPPPRRIYCRRFAGGCASRKQIRRVVVINPFSLESYLNTRYIHVVAAKIILLYKFTSKVLGRVIFTFAVAGNARLRKRVINRVSRNARLRRGRFSRIQIR